MFYLPLKKRLDCWYDFRQDLETDPNPFESTIKFFESRPKVKVYTDPYNPNTWPTPWELVAENQYCPFNYLLGVCYTLQLTDRFKSIQSKIAIEIDKNNKNVYYLLFVDDKVLGLEEDRWLPIDFTPKTLHAQKIYPMRPLH